MNGAAGRTRVSELHRIESDYTERKVVIIVVSSNKQENQIIFIRNGEIQKPVAQSVEQRPFKPSVEGSIPSGFTSKK